VKQDNIQQISHFIVLGRDAQDQSYLILEYNATQKSQPEVYWCHTNQPITVGEVVRGKLLPAKHAKVISDDSLSSQHQGGYLPTLLVEE
jgi:hypothetical protein